MAKMFRPYAPENVVGDFTTNNQFYFFDPYGIYAMPDCYPANVTDKITSSCVRYPLGWKGGQPAYP